MKVEANAQIEAKSGVSTLQAAQQEYQAMIIMNLLGKAAKDISDDAQSYGQDAAEKAQSGKGGKGKGAKGAGPAPKKADHAHKHSNGSGDAFLEAFLAQLAASQTVDKLAQSTVQSMLKYVNAQLESLDALKNEIKSLENQLKSNLTEAQIKQITAQLNALESQYNQALSEYNSAHGDYDKNKAAKNAAASDYAQKEAEYNKLDPNSPDAKKLKAEMDADQKTESSASSAMSADQGKMDAANKSIAEAVAGLSALASKYPSLKKNIDLLIVAMGAHENISNAASTINKQVAAIGTEDEKLENEIVSKESQEQALIKTLSNGSDAVKQALEQFVNGTQSIDLKQLAQAIAVLLGEQVSQLEGKTERNQDESHIAHITHENVDIRYDAPKYRHLEQRATHDIGSNRG